MDIDILLILQAFRNGVGSIPEDFFVKMTFLVSLILVSLIKLYLPGPVGSASCCFLQMFYVVFLFPMCTKWFERSKTAFC